MSMTELKEMIFVWCMEHEGYLLSIQGTKFTYMKKNGDTRTESIIGTVA